MPQDRPLVSIIIPTRNRLSDLCLTLRHICADPYPRVEVLVCDDASEEDPRPVLRAEFPAVHVERSERPLGPCAVRNRLASRARGPILVGLDDDCVLRAAGSGSPLATVVRLFEEHPRMGLLAMRVRRPDGSLWPPQAGPVLQPTATFIACGFAVRRDVFLRVGGFDPAIIRQGEERDLMIRLMDAGYDARRTDEVVADHRESPAQRDHQSIHALAIRNELLFVLRYVPAAFLPARLVRHVASHVSFCVRRGWWRALGAGLLRSVREAPGALARRRPVASCTWRRFVELMPERARKDRDPDSWAARGVPRAPRAFVAG